MSFSRPIVFILLVAVGAVGPFAGILAQDDAGSWLRNPDLAWQFPLVALGLYSGISFFVLRPRYRHDAALVAEVCDSVYFLGFLLTMAVLGATFLGDKAPDELLAGVGQGVLITLVGLALRVALALLFTSGTAAGDPDATGGSQVGYGAQSPEPTQRREQSLEMDAATAEVRHQVEQLQATRQLMEQAVLQTTQSIKQMDGVLSDLRVRSATWLDTVRTVNENVHTATTEMKTELPNALRAASAVVMRGARVFAKRLKRSEEEFEAQHRALTDVANKSLGSAEKAAERLGALTIEQLTALDQLAQRMVALSNEVRERCSQIPNPAEVLVTGLHSLTLASDELSTAIGKTRDAASATATQLSGLGNTAAATSPGVSGLGESIAALRASFARELKLVDGLLDEYERLVNRTGRITQ